MNSGASIVHLNVVDFASSVAMAADRSLRDRPFVIGGASASRAVLLGVSRRAREEGLSVGMTLGDAERRVRGLRVLSPDPAACAAAQSAMERVVSRYSPAIQDDSGGHLYFDLAGTSRLFGAPLDVIVRIRNEIAEAVGVDATVALAANKLTAKVATRSIRPFGIVGVRRGEESSFLAEQDASLLPGVGRAVARILAVAGLDTIGRVAALTDGEALALFGRRGPALRDAARGVDPSPITPGSLSARSVRRRLDFSSDVLDASVIRGGLLAIAEDAGLELRRELLAASRVSLAIAYADGATKTTEVSSRCPLVLDEDLSSAALKAWGKGPQRRVRVRSLGLSFSGLAPARREPDLFVPEGPSGAERLQTAVDAARIRYGPGSLTRATCLVASSFRA